MEKKFSFVIFLIIPRPRQLSLGNFAVVLSFLAALFGPANYRERILKPWQ